MTIIDNYGKHKCKDVIGDRRVNIISIFIFTLTITHCLGWEQLSDTKYT